MITGACYRSRRRGFDRRVQRAASSKTFDQLCPTLRRRGRCPLHEAHLERAAKARDERLKRLQDARDAAALLEDSEKNAANGESPGLTEEELDLLLADEEPLPTVEFWNECPFRHVRTAVGAAERDAVVNRLVEFFVLGKVKLTLHRAEVDPDGDPLEALKNPHVTCHVPTRRGRTIIASHFASRFGAYLGLDDAPPQYLAEDEPDAGESVAVVAPGNAVTGSNGAVAAATARLGPKRRRKADQPEFRSCAELSLRSAKVCGYLARALAILKQRRVPIDGIILSHNDVMDLETLLGALKKHKLHEDVHFLDASHNELETLRFLFYLRANYPNLVSLRLLDNPITRKPEYREQLRKTLPDLMRLDDESVRRPPLTLPFPRPSPCPSCPKFDRVTRFVAALFDSFERDLVDEDFAQRHFHPSVTFTASIHPDCLLALPSYAMTSQQQAAQLKHSDIEKGVTARRLRETWLVTPQDAREAELFGVAIKAANRDLRVGKEALQKYARGPIGVQNAYAASLYPPRFPAEHHLHFAAWEATTLPVPLATLSRSVKIVAAPAADLSAMPESTKKKKKDPKLPTAAKPAPPTEVERGVFLASRAAPEFELVTVHGVMTWRIPSVHGEAAFRCFYDRTLTLLPKPGYVAPSRNGQGPDGWGDEDDLVDALDAYHLYNDQVSLRPVVTVKATELHRRDAKACNDAQCLPSARCGRPVFDPRDQPEYVRRLAMVYQTDEATVRAALERSTSDACVHEVLAEVTGGAAGQLAVERIDETVPVAPAEDAAAAQMDAKRLRDGQGDLEPALRRHQTEPFVPPASRQNSVAGMAPPLQ